MEDRKIEVALTIAVAVFIIALVGVAAWWIGHQDTGLAGNDSAGKNSENSGAAGLFPAPDRSREAAKAGMHGQITLDGRLPDTERRTLADGTAYGGVVQLNYSQEKKYAPLIVGACSTGGLIDASGNYSIEDVYVGVPFTATVTLYLKNGEEPLARQITDGGSARQFIIGGPAVLDFDLVT